MGITISNSQGLWLEFSLRSTRQHMWVMGVYIVWVRIEYIRNENLAKQNVLRVSCWKALRLVRRPYLRDTHENQLSPFCLDSSHSSYVQGMCITLREAYSLATRENSFSLQ